MMPRRLNESHICILHCESLQIKLLYMPATWKLPHFSSPERQESGYLAVSAPLYSYITPAMQSETYCLHCACVLPSTPMTFVDPRPVCFHVDSGGVALTTLALWAWPRWRNLRFCASQWHQIVLGSIDSGS